MSSPRVALGHPVATFALLTLCLLGALRVASAQLATEPPAQPPPPVPDPIALSADWWVFFETATPEQFPGRAAQFQERLDGVVMGLQGVSEASDRARALSVEIAGLVEALSDARSARPQAAAAPVGAVPDKYSFEEFLQLAVKKQELALEVELASDDSKEQEAAVRAAKQAIDDGMAAYMTLEPAAPDRLLKGLEIVRARFLWALGEVELVRLRGVLARLDAARVRIAEELERGPQALTASTEDVRAWTAKLSEARETRNQKAAAAASVRLRTAALPDNPRGRALRRRQQQRLLDLEAQAMLATLQAAEAELAIDLLANQGANPPGEEVLRTHRNALRDVLAQVEQKLPTWRRATDRERGAATQQVSDSEDAARLAAINQTRLEQADATLRSLTAVRRQVARCELLSDMASAQLLSQGGQISELAAEAGRTLEVLWESLVDLSGRSLFTVNETPVTTLGLVRLTFIILVAWLISRLVGKAFARLMSRRETMNRASIYTLSRLFHYVILVIGFLVALSSIGIDFTKFALIASAFGVGLGFGLQAIFSNFVAGLIILFERSLKVGDFVELESGVGGEVQGISIRSTLITTNDNIDVLVPNSEFVNGRVTNWTLREANRRIRVPFGVAYGSDKELVKQAALEAADEVQHTLKVSGREAQVWLVNFGDSSLDFELVVWLTPDAVKRPSSVHAAYCWAIETALARHGLEIPFPQRDLHLRSMFGHKDEAGRRLVDELRGTGPDSDGAAPATDGDAAGDAAGDPPADR